ncbi:hypothetical protein L226DRAFT_220196 [Lentinus tigrinus ALCF2SS1-7]|uniref:Uncharacterized protein n=1 Tax=Lentinus tigrinus ALCF2SS1-6 TaxID=1328759 RepID=A0A5C2S6F1_9APHY|nr:hypothetical protein L227DRAFT_160290 [Lentinus tigrinus ALCF2SS1-6]RPD70784.1 hypothetical protein L226DRAFT_220196 [Lentinus tigrinus ALCF2SS1-7]
MCRAGHSHSLRGRGHLTSRGSDRLCTRRPFPILGTGGAKVRRPPSGAMVHLDIARRSGPRGDANNASCFSLPVRRTRRGPSERIGRTDGRVGSSDEDAAHHPALFRRLTRGLSTLGDHHRRPRARRRPRRPHAVPPARPAAKNSCGVASCQSEAPSLLCPPLRRCRTRLLRSDPLCLALAWRLPLGCIAVPFSASGAIVACFGGAWYMDTRPVTPIAGTRAPRTLKQTRA